MDAILSDIEGNLEALEAVLDSARQHKVDRIICLGDLVGYGPNPVECVELLRGSDVYIASEWDLAAASIIEPEWHRSMLRKLDWLRKQFENRPDLLNFLCSGKFIHTSGNKTYFHGTPQSRSEFIFPEDIYIPEKLDRIVDASTNLSFCGNSHVPGYYIKALNWIYGEARDFQDWTPIHGSFIPMICNVGSVGQPRDGDTRAAYVLDDGDRIRFMRVEYDSEKTRRKILDNPDQDDNDGERLKWGR